MFDKLQMLTDLNAKADALVAEINEVNNSLHNQYKAKEVAAIDEFMADMRELAKYAKQLNHKTFWTDIKLKFYTSSYGGYPELVVEFEDDGNFIIEANPSGYGYRPRVYNDKFSDCGIVSAQHDPYHLGQDFVDGWSWKTKEMKRFIALHATEIISDLEKRIYNQMEKEIKNKTNAAISKQKGIVSDIEKLDKEN